VWSPLQRERVQVSQREFGAPGLESTGAMLTTQDGRYFQIEQLRCGETFSTQPGTRAVSVNPIVGQGGRDDIGVNDEHAHPAMWTPPS